MKNFRYLIPKEYEVNRIAEDLLLQLEVNRLKDVNVKAVIDRNEILIQVKDANDSIEEVVGSFMESYDAGVILE